MCAIRTPGRRPNRQALPLPLRTSIGEEIGVLWLVPAWTMRATAAECLLPVTSQAIRKHFRDRGVGAGVAPEFMAERNSELVDIRDGAPTTPSVPRLANRRCEATRASRLGFVLARASDPRRRARLCPTLVARGGAVGVKPVAAPRSERQRRRRPRRLSRRAWNGSSSG
jgi:hypothetical protein